MRLISDLIPTERKWRRGFPNNALSLLEGFPIDLFSQNLGQLFDIPATEKAVLEQTDLEFIPKVHIKDNKESITFKVELPGIDKKDVTLKVTDDRLIISGEKKSEVKGENDGTEYSEVKYGKFERSFLIKKGELDTDNAKASVDNGVLTLTIPKISKESKEKVIPLSH